MKINYTKDQQKVIEVHEKNVLVAAAAGSGKTAVLVERIVQMISDPKKKIDIDRLLVVTFTKAAAAEMRERISKALGNRLQNEPENLHLQKQVTLIHNAQITTIDSFCLFVLKNNFNEVGLDPTFRVADSGEIKLLEEEVLKEVLEEKYQAEEEAFFSLVDSFGKNGKDEALEETIKKMRNFAMSYPFPIEWLENCKNTYADEKAPYLDFVTTYIKDILLGILDKIQYMIRVAEESDGPYMYLDAIRSEEAFLQSLCAETEFANIGNRLAKFSFSSLPRKKDDSISSEKRELIKNIRNGYKKELVDLTKNYFFEPLENLFADLSNSKEIIASLVDCVIAFHYAFLRKKREKNMIDFSDMEHLALEILITHENGKVVPTKVAREYQEYFQEILIDEYQDSNLVQEFLLQSIAKTGKGENNCFMVGDVKQSIYKFRLARPDIFMSKYERYKNENEEEVRIDLHQNFRSRNEILEVSNLIFSQIMHKDLGGVSYDEDAMLNPGASYVENEEEKVEILIADTTMFSEKRMLSKEKIETEARVISKKIKELVGISKIFDKEINCERYVQYRDIVILLRTYTGWDEIFHQVLTEEGIPSFVDSKTGYFSATEVQFILDFIKVLDNPYQDIPLCGVLLSLPIGFTEEELSFVRIASKERVKETGEKEKLYASIKEFVKMGDKKELVLRYSEFLELIEDFRNRVSHEPIHQLIQEIYEEVNSYAIFSVLPEGEQRSRNLDMLLEKAIQFENTSYHGLFHFVRYIEQLHKYDVDFGEASVLEETANVVQIISIHKSKGLEFPICIVAGMAKQFNKKDYVSPFVIEGDLGVGMEYVDLKKRITKPTIRRNALITKMRMDALGEELRVLYVALTRAKEKLIITAATDKIEDLVKEYGYLLTKKDGKLPFLAKANASSYLDLLIAALCRHQSMEKICGQYGLTQDRKSSIYAMQPHIKINILGKEDIENLKGKEQIGKEFWKQSLFMQFRSGSGDKEMENKILSKFRFVYPYRMEQGMFTKTTVSELKMEAMEEEAHSMFKESKKEPYLPAFMRESEEISGSVRGSAFHKFLELYSFDEIPKEEEIVDLLVKYNKNGRMPKEYVAAVLPDKIMDFMHSDIAKRMVEAKRKSLLFKEQPFVLAVDANRINDEYPEEEKILVQGIIDVFFEENGELVVLDYKTDRVKTEKELIKRYQTQLEYYGEALEKLTGKKVKEKQMYSFALKKSVPI